jgi:hypothetical protein
MMVCIFAPLSTPEEVADQIRALEMDAGMTYLMAAEATA